jgi:hypothetical protein
MLWLCTGTMDSFLMMYHYGLPAMRVRKLFSVDVKTKVDGGLQLQRALADSTFVDECASQGQESGISHQPLIGVLTSSVSLYFSS